MNGRTIFFILAGYLSGSVLYARVFSQLMNKEGVVEESADHNPGTSNAFQYGGFWCGLLTLACDLAKGYLPVHLYLDSAAMLPPPGHGFALLLAAPVIGHAFPVFYHFHGGKGIAVTFGCLIGLLPFGLPLLLLAGCFLAFSLVLKISPNYYRTAAAYLAALACMYVMDFDAELRMGFLMISIVVCLRLCLSREERERMRVKLLWMH